MRAPRSPYPRALFRRLRGHWRRPPDGTSLALTISWRDTHRRRPLSSEDLALVGERGHMERLGIWLPPLARLLVPGSAWAQEGVYKWHGGMHPMGGVWGFGMMLLFWAILIIGTVFGIRWLVAQGRAPGKDTALEMLRERYARGEINRDEFEARKRDLAG